MKNVDRLKAAAWLNESRMICDTVVSPRTALALLTLVRDEHYITFDAASDSMTDVAESLKRPMRLWRSPHGEYFFAHALLNAAEFGCEVIASHHPQSA